MAAETKVLHQSVQAMEQEAVSLLTDPVQAFEHEKAPPTDTKQQLKIRT